MLKDDRIQVMRLQIEAAPGGETGFRQDIAAQLKQIESRKPWMWITLQASALAIAGICAAVPEIIGGKFSSNIAGPAGLSAWLSMQALPPWRRWTGNSYKSRTDRLRRYVNGVDTLEEFLTE